MSRFIAIDADAGGLFVASGATRGGSVRIEQAVVSLDDPRPLSSMTVAELAPKLKALLANARIPAAPVLVCLGRDRVVFKDIRHPKTAPSDEPAVVRFQSQRDLTESPDDLHMDYVPVPNPSGEDCRATVVFVRKDLYAAAKALCEQVGLKLAGITPRPFATVAALRSAIANSAVPPPDDPQAPIAVLSVWDGGGEFVVYQGDHLLFTRTITASALSSETALIGETKRSMTAAAAQHRNVPPQAIYLAEGHSSGGSWAARLQTALPVPVYPIDPLNGSTDVPPGLRGRFLGPVGLLVGRSAGTLPINFVAPRQPRAEPNKVRNRGLLAGLLLLTILGAAAGFAYWLRKDLDKRIAAKMGERDDVIAKLKAMETDINRIKAVEEFKARDLCWLDVMYDISATHPNIDKIRFKEFRGEIETPKVEAKRPGLGGLTSTIPKPGATLPGGAAGLLGNKTTVAAKPVEKKPAGKLFLRFVTPENQLSEDLNRVFASDDKSYRNSDVEPVVNASGNKGDLREYTIKVDVIKKAWNEYTRKFQAIFPKVNPTIPANPDTVFDEGQQ